MENNKRLVHDAAVMMAKVLLERVGGCIREETHEDAFGEFYVICKAGIEAYCIQEDRLRERLKPGSN